MDTLPRIHHFPASPTSRETFASAKTSRSSDCRSPRRLIRGLRAWVPDPSRSAWSFSPQQSLKGLSFVAFSASEPCKLGSFTRASQIHTESTRVDCWAARFMLQPLQVRRPCPEAETPCATSNALPQTESSCRSQPHQALPPACAPTLACLLAVSDRLHNSPPILIGSEHRIKSPGGSYDSERASTPA